MAIKRSTGMVNKMGGAKTNLLANGSFTSTAGLTSVSATLASTPGGQSGNCLTITNSAGVSGSAYEDVATIVGRVYRLDVYFKKGSGSGCAIKIGTTGDDDELIQAVNHSDVDFTKHSFVFIASATTTRISYVNSSAVAGETALFDTAVLEELLDGFVEIFRNCKIAIYSTPRPATADDAATGTLIATVTKEGLGVGFTFDEPTNGTVTKPSGDVWKGLNQNSAAAAWFRCYEEGDVPGNASTTKARFDGSISLTGGGGDMISSESNINATAGLNFEVTGFSYIYSRG